MWVSNRRHAARNVDSVSAEWSEGPTATAGILYGERNPPKKTVLDHPHTPWNTFTFTAIESFTKPSTGPYSVFTTGPAEPTVTHSSEDVNIASKSNAAITIFF